MDFVSKNLTAGQLDTIVKKLGGEEGAIRFINGELVVAIPTPVDFPVWKTIRLGTGLKSADDFYLAIKKAKMEISNWANDILRDDAFKVSDGECDADLVNVSVAELGFEFGASRRDIHARALRFGLHLCPVEVGPQLRLQYPDQSKDEWLSIGMEPINIGGNLRMFNVGNNDRSWLYGDIGFPGGFCGGEIRFVFVRSRK